MLLTELNQALKLHKKGTGIAISIPVGAIQGWLYKLPVSVPDNAIIEKSEKEVEQEIIFIVVPKEDRFEVMSAITKEPIISDLVHIS